MPGLSRCGKSATAPVHDKTYKSKMGVMGKVLLALAALIILVIVGGGLFLAYAPSTAPSQKVEKVLPDARFPR
jgi:hypothetical protein